ncbi:MAG: hybrid sensor histidine kinase/response regulator [Ramlibacter sp.]|jgi:PAS domain S-box-containing protein|nr:hybrid sensor histidine kinase/response regulator [Ramlibacter sp.]
MSGDDQPASPATELDQLRLFISSVTDYAIYMLSPEGKVASWNAGAERFKGYRADEIIGQHFSRFYSPEDQADGLPSRALRTARDTGKFEAEGWRVRKDGTRFWAHVVIDPIHDDDDRLVGFAKITRDITERKNAAAALEETREALFQAQKMEALGQLTGGIAHDFNNLLNVVTNGISMLRERVGEPADVRMLDAIDQAASRGALLTQQLLSFARQQPLKEEPRDANRVINSFEVVLRRASRSAIAFEVKPAARLPQVLLDAAQFETALLNLVANARDATPDGGRIVLSTQCVELAQKRRGLHPGRYVVVAVQDTGQGMSPDVACRAVEPFFTTKELGKGTGLGLSQVYGLVQQSGGDLDIVSHPGQGTTMSMYFPALDVLHDEGPEPDAAEKVLVVDDQPDVLEITSELFRTLGFDVLSADSGEHALEMLERTPDLRLMLSDVVMPGMSGIQLARKAKVLSPALKVILSSGYANPAVDKDPGCLDGFNFLPKPYRMADLVKMLRSIG